MLLIQYQIYQVVLNVSRQPETATGFQSWFRTGISLQPESKKNIGEVETILFLCIPLVATLDSCWRNIQREGAESKSYVIPNMYVFIFVIYMNLPDVK